MVYKMEFWKAGVKVAECLEGERITIDTDIYLVKFFKDKMLLKEEEVNVDRPMIFFMSTIGIADIILTQPPEVIAETITEEVGEVVV